MSERRLHDLGDQAYAAVFQTLYPVWERAIRRRATPKHLASLEKSQWLSPAERREEEAGTLRRLLSYAGTHVPYYREVFRERGFDPRGVRSRDDLEALPLLTRDIVRERYADLVDPAHRGKNLKKGTSGSTGTPLRLRVLTQQ